MSISKTLATTDRVFKQLRHDKRTMALILFMPILLITLLKYVFEGQPRLFNAIGPVVLGIFPLIIMFLVTSIVTLRERTSGTLDRLMTLPIAKPDLIFGYALAFASVGFLQAVLASIVMLGLLDVTVLGGTLPVILTAVFAAFLGTALGLFVSAFARNEFQAVQLVIPIIMPQVLLCGLFIPRGQMADWLTAISNVLPLTYSVDAMQQVARYASWTNDLTKDLCIVGSFGIAVLILGAATIRRQER